MNKTQYHAGAFTFNPLLVLLSFIIMLSGAIYHNNKNNPSLDDTLLTADESSDDEGTKKKKKKKLEFSASVKAVHLTEVVLCGSIVYACSFPVPIVNITVTDVT